uniref:DDE Tnp4 domain-containing protein n=1 Tax=Pelodiscus sinensis TaxID=13735 RepID=K7EZ91_PELSI
MAGFAALGFPNYGGAIDGTHIPIRTPQHGVAQYINRKGHFSMVLYALVNHCGQFMDIFVRWSSRAQNARIFRNSSLYGKLEADTFFPHWDFMVGDVQMPLCIMGDVAYILMPWLMQPYTSHLEPSRDQFNAHLNQAKIQVECAFGLLKVPCRWLLTRLDVGKYNISKVVSACHVLHNIVERKGEVFLPGSGADASCKGRPFEQQ